MDEQKNDGNKQNESQVISNQVMEDNSMDEQKIDGNKRKEILEIKVREFIANGYRIESQTESSAVVISGKPVNHIFHFIMFVVTSTFWWPVWLYLAIKNRVKRQLITIDEFGNIEAKEVKN